MTPVQAGIPFTKTWTGGDSCFPALAEAEAADGLNPACERVPLSQLDQTVWQWDASTKVTPCDMAHMVAFASQTPFPIFPYFLNSLMRYLLNYCC